MVAISLNHIVLVSFVLFAKFLQSLEDEILITYKSYIYTVLKGEHIMLLGQHFVNSAAVQQRVTPISILYTVYFYAYIGESGEKDYHSGRRPDRGSQCIYCK